MFYIDERCTPSIPLGLMPIIFLALTTWPVTWGYWNTCFLVALSLLIVRIPNLEVAIKRLLHQGSFSAMFVHGSESLQLFLRYPSVICYNRQVLYEGHKNYFKNWCLMNSQPTFLFFSEFKLIELWPYYQKHVNQIITSDASICSTMAFPPIGKFWSCCLNFHWLSIKFTMGCPISLHSLWLFSCWLGWSLWSFERCSIGGYL